MYLFFKSANLSTSILNKIVENVYLPKPEDFVQSSGLENGSLNVDNQKENVEDLVKLKKFPHKSLIMDFEIS